MAFFIDNKLIFSDERKYRIRRHLLFWLFWGIYSATVRQFLPNNFKSMANFPSPFQSLAQTFLGLLPQAVFVYPLLYFFAARLYIHWEIHQSGVLGCRAYISHDLCKCHFTSCYTLA